MKKINVLITSLCCIFLFSSFITKEDPITALLKKLEELSKKYPQEKVHLHLDKPYYAIGDDIWFKAYLADARTSLPRVFSSILYVELINERDSIQQQLKLPIQDGITWGDFKLADTLNEGNYRIRAYTQLMRNLGSEFFFDKNIKIGKKWNNKVYTTTDFGSSIKDGKERMIATIAFTDPEGKAYTDKTINYEIWNEGNRTAKGKDKTDNFGQLSVLLPQQQDVGSKLIATIDLGKERKTTKTIPLISKSLHLDVQFFPEGGYLVQSLSSKIAIKSLDINGLGKDITGRIIDETGAEVANFSTSYLGMGSFFLNPLAGKSYTAKIKLNDGSEQSVPLPKAQTSGYLLSANNTDPKSINVKITLSADLLNKGDLNLIAHKNGEVKLATKIPSNKQLTKINLEKSELPSGIIQLTLFSPENIPVAERIVFVKNDTDKFELELKELKQNYDKREQVEVAINAAPQENLAAASFSVSVTNASVIIPDSLNESNILSGMLLSPDLKGYIEQPNSYFLGNEQQNNERLDNLMLTQGWRKIDWKNLDIIPTFAAEDGIHISGRVSKNGKPLPKSKVTLVSNVGGMSMEDTISDGDGKFAFKDLIFEGRQKFLVQARSESDKKTVDILLDTVPPLKLWPNRSTPDLQPNVNDGMNSYLEQSNSYFEERIKAGTLAKTIHLKEVKIVGKKNPAERSANLNGPGKADQVFDGDDMIYATSIQAFLLGKSRVPLAQDGSIGGLPIQKRTPIILDGNVMPLDFSLNDVLPENVESIEVLASISNFAIYGGQVGGPTLVVTTRTRPIQWPVVKYAPGLVTYRPTGYCKAREFYSPRYDVEPNDRPDLRTTVYWNPNLTTDDKGKLKFDYFNTDQPGTYRIVIEGIDALGKLGRKVYTYNVK